MEAITLSKDDMAMIVCKALQDMLILQSLDIYDLPADGKTKVFYDYKNREGKVKDITLTRKMAIDIINVNVNLIDRYPKWLTESPELDLYCRHCIFKLSYC